jgi:hypothetical protein
MMIVFIFVSLALVHAQLSTVGSSSVADPSASSAVSADASSPSVVCDAVMLALALTAAAKNDTCFRRSATCEQCAVDTVCGFCPFVHVDVSGDLFGTEFQTTCDVHSLCWQGTPFWFGGDIDHVAYEGNNLSLTIRCDSVLPQFGQCALSGIMLLVAASAAALAICCCIVLSISFCFCMICRRRSTYKNGYTNLESTTPGHVQNSYSGNRAGYGSYK